MSSPVTLGGIVGPDAVLARKAAALAERAHSQVALNHVQRDWTATEAVPAVVSMLIDNAVAALDAGRATSRSYLMRASAILRARSAHEVERCPRPLSTGGLARWQLNRVIDYIEQHLAERITGEDLAGLIGVSVGQLFRAFKVSVGVPPLRYVAARRLDLACSLLRASREPLSQIALRAGFCDQSHLCRVFRRLMGITPGAWRRVNAADPAGIGSGRVDAMWPGSDVNSSGSRAARAA